MGKVIAIKGVILLNANNNCLVVEVFPQHDLEVLISLGFVLSFWVVLEHFIQKIYITTTEVVGEKRIDLAYLIWNVESSKAVAIVSMFSDNIQYQIGEPLKVLLIMNEKEQLLEGVFMNRELNVFLGRKLITTPLDTNNNIIKTSKLACVIEMVLSLDELDNTENLEDGRLSNILLRYHVTGSEEFMSYEPVSPQYKRLKNPGQ